jgi:voltage-dependent anion channel protein 2
MGPISPDFDNGVNVLDFYIFGRPRFAQLLIHYHRPGITLTQNWTTTNSLDTKVEFKDVATKGLKAELLGGFLPNSAAKSAKLNLHYQQTHFHTRAFFDLVKGPTATVDAVIGSEGFMAGGELGYDVNKAAITKYSAAVGYKATDYTAAITATNNLSVFAASYYHKVGDKVEAGAKAVWDSKTSTNVGLEVAGKYRHDTLSFSKVCGTSVISELLLM